MRHQLFLLYKLIMSWYIRFCGRRSRLEKATRQAERMHLKTGKRYRVFFFGYKYRVWTRQDIKDRKNVGLLKRYLKAGEDFDRIAFHDTNKKGAAPCHS